MAQPLVGDRIDLENSRFGEELTWNMGVEWNLNRHMLLRVQQTSSRLHTQNGERIFDAELTDFRVTWQFNRTFLRFTGQRQLVTRNLPEYLSPALAEDETFRTELLYSYKVNPQTALYVRHADSGPENDVIPAFERTGRTVFAKLSYAWLQ